MHSIGIEYYPFFRFGKSRTAKGSVPESWQDFHPEQLLAVIQAKNDTINETRFLSVMTGIKPKIIRRTDRFQRYKIISLVETVIAVNPHNSFILPQINAGGLIFYPPKNKLKAMPFGQFIYTETLFDQYMESHDETHLHQFISALYLPYGDAFTEDIITRYSPFMKRLRGEIKESIVLNYHLVKKWLYDTYPLVFLNDEKKQSGGKEKNDPMAWIKIFENFVGDDIVNHDRYAQMPVHNVMRYLSKKIKENMKKRK